MAKKTKEESLNYEVRIIAAGSRKYGDYDFFKRSINEFILANKLTKDKTIFLSGLAKGPDKFIVKWCEECGWDYSEYPADWNNLTHPKAILRRNDFGELYDAGAGLRRNIEMAENATHLVAFWDNKSTGTKHMLSVATKFNLSIHLFKI